MKKLLISGFLGAGAFFLLMVALLFAVIFRAAGQAEPGHAIGLAALIGSLIEGLLGSPVFWGVGIGVVVLGVIGMRRLA